MNAKRIVATTLVLLAALCAATAWAGEPLKVAVADIQRCLTDSVRGKELKAGLMVSAEKFRAEMTEKEAEFRALVADFEKQQLLLSETALQERKQALLARKQSFEQEVEAQRAQIRAEEEKLSKVIFRELKVILLEMVEKGGYDLVLTNQGPWMLYWDEKMDVTNELIRRYDDSVKKAE